VPIGELNPIEMSAVFGHHKLLAYFMEEIGVKSLKDLKVGILIDEMQFIVAPIFKRDSETVKLILD